MHDTPDGWIVELGQMRALAAAELNIGADPSSAAFPLVAAAIVPGSEVMVRGMIVNPLRTGLYETLEAMGADIELSQRAHPVRRDRSRCPCRVIQLCSPATFAPSKSRR